MSYAYYNENNREAAAWLRELISHNFIADGFVDERSIVEVEPPQLLEFTQCHFFAGIGGWSYALRLAGWPDDAPVWTGSCPCQPFSVAGKQKGVSDERHLWPEFHRLIAQCRPATVFGEQVASKDGRGWLAGVRSDLEALGYDFGGADLCAAGIGEKNSQEVAEATEKVIELARYFDERGNFKLSEKLYDFANYISGIIIGAPHIRQRLFWVADSECDARGEGWVANESPESIREKDTGASIESGRCRLPGGLGKPDSAGREQGKSSGASARYGSSVIATGDSSRLGNANNKGLQGRSERSEQHTSQLLAGQTGAWSEFDIIPCADGKARRIESGSQPLVAGIPHRVGLLRGYGNSIVPQVAAQFIQAFNEAKEMTNG